MRMGQARDCLPVPTGHPVGLCQLQPCSSLRPLVPERLEDADRFLDLLAEPGGDHGVWIDGHQGVRQREPGQPVRSQIPSFPCKVPSPLEDLDRFLATLGLGHGTGELVQQIGQRCVVLGQQVGGPPVEMRRSLQISSVSCAVTRSAQVERGAP